MPEGGYDRTISTELVYECMTCILEKRSFRNKIPYNLISTTLSSLLEQSIYQISADQLIKCYTSIPTIDINQIVEQRSISADLTTKKKEELSKIIRWIMPFIKQSTKPTGITSSIFIVSMDPGQGKTSLSIALEKAARHITAELKQDKKGISRTVMNSELETQTLDITSYGQGSIVIADGFMKPQSIMAMENITYVIFVDRKQAARVKALFNQNMVYTLEIEDMDITEIMELIEKRFVISQEVRPVLLKTVQKMVEAGVNPKKILSIINFSSLLDNELNRTKGFSFNQSTVEYVVAQAGVNFGYDFNLATLDGALRKSVFGQEHAINLVVDAVGIAKYGMRRKNKPLLTAMFGGATGIGKTELANALSKYLFGEGSLLRIDMGEYTEHHSVARLIGSPPGYVGYSTDTAFASALKKTTRRVILFDEIEKAAPDVHQLLLGMMDNARLTLSTGEIIDLRESVLIMTTNALADRAGKLTLGFSEAGTNRDALADYRKELQKSKIFSYEFINRIDAIIPFNTLTEEAAIKIANREIDIIREELQYHGYMFTYTEEAFRKLIANSDKTQGGRGIIRGIDSWKRQVVTAIRTGKVLLVNNRRTIEIKETVTF